MAKKTEKLSYEEVKALLDKQYGKGSIISGGALPKCKEFVSTGSLRLDIAIGIGGVPMDGRIIELMGPESSGKSSLCQNIVGNYQVKYPNKKVIYVDSEHSLDSDYSPALGVRLDDLDIIQMDGSAGEGAFNKVKALVATGEVGLVVFDSYNGMLPAKLLEGEAGESSMGVHARMLGPEVAKTNSATMKYGCNYLYVGQIRNNIGNMFLPSETTQGGNALKFFAHLRLKTSRSLAQATNTLDENDEKIANLHKVEVIKNKVGRPFRKAEFDIIYGKGIDKITELLEVGEEYGILKKGTKYYEDLFHNKKEEKDVFVQMLLDNPEYFDAIREAILDKALPNRYQEGDVVEDKNPIMPIQSDEDDDTNDATGFSEN